jgi:hypothetical protein
VSVVVIVDDTDSGAVEDGAVEDGVVEDGAVDDGAGPDAGAVGFDVEDVDTAATIAVDVCDTVLGAVVSVGDGAGIGDNVVDDGVGVGDVVSVLRSSSLSVFSNGNFDSVLFK